MRKIEKTLNIKNANILAEQRYVQKKLGLSENVMSEGESVEDFFNFIESDPRLNSFSYLDYTSTLDIYQNQNQIQCLVNSLKLRDINSYLVNHMPEQLKLKIQNTMFNKEKVNIQRFKVIVY